MKQPSNILLNYYNPARAAQTPTKKQCALWIQCVLVHCFPKSKTIFELSLKCVTRAESQKLNNAFRKKDYATNVLSFPAQNKIRLTAKTTELYLGDLAICSELVAEEARVQKKPVQAHWAHLVMHGTLHLLGYDHVKLRDAKVMEALETTLLEDLGFQNPYS